MELLDAIKETINWSQLPKIVSTDLFQQIKGFLLREKEAGRILSAVDDLYRAFCQIPERPEEMASQAEFDTCIGLVQSRGKMLNFGGLLLLQPEWLDTYASAIVNAAKSEPDGLGQLGETETLEGAFRMPSSERLNDSTTETLLLISTVEELLRREIALREATNEGVFLVFPTQLTRERSDIPEQQGKFVVFEFQGAVLNVYATLVVRLAHSRPFPIKEMWKNGVRFTLRGGGTCGLSFREIEEGKAEVVLFADGKTLEQIRFQFEEYVATHLSRRAVARSVERTPVFVCSGCGFVVTEQLVRLRAERGFNWVKCPCCGTRTALVDWVRRLHEVANSVGKMDKRADEMRDKAAAMAVLEGKIAVGDFDVFLAYHSKDKEFVEIVASQLKGRGLYPWLDSEQVLPGRAFQDEMEKGLNKAKAIAIFVGQKGLGRWEDMELKVAVSKFIKKKLPVIPVLLPRVVRLPRKHPILHEFNYIRFAEFGDDQPSLDVLESGIRGRKRP